MREQRMSEIMKIIGEKGFADMQELAEELDVSISTVRRDIAELSRNKLVSYSKNIVVPVSENSIDGPFSFRAGMNSQAKQAISKEAVRLIKDGSTVFIDSSSTALPMAGMLPGSYSLTVVTNGLHVLERIRSSRIQVQLVGGEMSVTSHGFYGPLAEESLRRYNFDFGFFSPVAVTPQNYAAETSLEAASIRQVAMERTACPVLLFDHTKVGLRRPYNFARLEEFHYLVTDDAAHEFGQNVQVCRVRT